jgi:tellurite resistance protein
VVRYREQALSKPTVKPEQVAAAMRAVESSTDAEQLKRLMERAQEMGVPEVYKAAFAKRLSLLPGDAPGTVAHDLWKSIYALEQIRSEEAGKTVRLSRTRQKLQRVGVMKLLEDFATHKTSTDGFDMLIERSLPELTGEAIVLRHRQHFSEDVVRAARARLERVGVDISKLPGGLNDGGN